MFEIQLEVFKYGSINNKNRLVTSRKNKKKNQNKKNKFSNTKNKTMCLPYVRKKKS